MSGIAGVIGRITPDSVADKMLATMKRRGPDRQMCIIDTACCLLHSSQIPVNADHGKQPIHCTWGTEQYTIIYDGQIYNKDEVRRELICAGHYFDTNTDTEIVLRAYIHWKEKCLDILNGVFAFAVWHTKEQKLFAARDRIGVKPFFYRVDDGVLWFASEIKTILAHPDVPAQLDSYGVAQLMLLGPGRIPGSGVFKDIYELKPGHYGIFCNGEWAHKQYWKLTDQEHTDSFEQTAACVRELVLDAIGRQFDPDMEIGAFLSGGLDSSIVSTVCSELCIKEGKQLQTFSVDYENNDKYFVSNRFQPESDRHYIDLMRSSIGSKHQSVILSADDLVNCMDEATKARDLPGMADVDFSLFAFSKQVRQQVSVAFSGECADEIFGGYPWYTDPAVRAVDGFPWAQNTGFRAGFILPEHLKNIEPNVFVTDLYKTTINNSDILPGTSRLERRMKEMFHLNFDWFMQTLLDRNDRMTMYHSLDVRVPFCDYRIAEYLYRVPWHYKNHADREKGLLRYAMRDLLPAEVLYRKKSPYPKTYDPGYLQIVTEQMQQQIDDPCAPILQIVKKDSLQKLLNAEFSWPWYGQLMKLPQTIAYMLQINRWLLLYNVNIV